MKDLTELELQLKKDLQNELIDLGLQYLNEKKNESKMKKIEIAFQSDNGVLNFARLEKDSSLIRIQYPKYINEKGDSEMLYLIIDEYDLRL
jgi:hypothetical protein